jgi:hypothetical protein
VAVGCQVPKFQGPQIQNPPEAFTIKNDLSQARRMFPERDVLYHAAWVEASWGHFSGIYINGHPGTTQIQDVEDARLAAIDAAREERVEFGALEEIVVDGRPAWGWGEVWRLPNDGVRYAVFRAAVPYDTVTYAVDFRTGDPIVKFRPDSLRTVVASFAIGKTEWNYPLIAILAGVVLLVGARLRARARARVERLRQITLVQVPKRDGERHRMPPPSVPRMSPGSGAPGG